MYPSFSSGGPGAPVPATVLFCLLSTEREVEATRHAVRRVGGTVRARSGDGEQIVRIELPGGDGPGDVARIKRDIISAERFRLVWNGFCGAPSSELGWQIQFGAWERENQGQSFEDFVRQFPERLLHWRHFEAQVLAGTVPSSRA